MTKDHRRDAALSLVIDKLAAPAQTNLLCSACDAIERGVSGFCRDHKRVLITADTEPAMAKLLSALAASAGIVVATS